MKAIIIAAGTGRRMRPLTDVLPKCMLDFGGKTLLEIHLETFRACGINDISVIKGHLAEKINLPNLKYYQNDRYAQNNILNSLFYAEGEMNDDVVIIYSDIYFKKFVLDKLVSSAYDISIVVDTAWRFAYRNRNSHPLQEAENVKMTPLGTVKEIGKQIKEKEKAEAEFIGMVKLSKKGCEIFKEIFCACRDRFWDKPFHEALTFEKAYLTDLIQELVDRQIEVYGVTIEGGWQEIDTLQDYKKVKKALFT